ncbi:hypothetical protein K443DRAFT_681131 [Laccaria amethystina LaAM-08-1]|uniref:Uncharacterized protein n=1 Tax=Laccaria amethystina LaAM-08-1 TaxID=1095629 RepID=A0A0C9WMB2_9AGAR|nr:hypothetical protein K443DRAFT_681131 [Laccaria amethystina LaAM-08-1]
MQLESYPLLSFYGLVTSSANRLATSISEAPIRTYDFLSQIFSFFLTTHVYIGVAPVLLTFHTG